MKGYPVIDMAATGANILKLRRKSGLSVAQMQQYFGFDAPQAIYKWQRGETLPSTDNLVALSYLLDVPIDEILIRSKPSESAPLQEDSCGGPLYKTIGLNYEFSDCSIKRPYHLFRTDLYKGGATDAHQYSDYLTVRPDIRTLYCSQSAANPLCQ